MRLQRLEGGARIDGGFDVAPLRDELAAGVADRDGAAVAAFDCDAARDFDENGVHRGFICGPKLMTRCRRPSGPLNFSGAVVTASAIADFAGLGDGPVRDALVADRDIAVAIDAAFVA